MNPSDVDGLRENGSASVELFRMAPRRYRLDLCAEPAPFPPGAPRRRWERAVKGPFILEYDCRRSRLAIACWRQSHLPDSYAGWTLFVERAAGELAAELTFVDLHRRRPADAPLWRRTNWDWFAPQRFESVAANVWGELLSAVEVRPA